MKYDVSFLEKSTPVTVVRHNESERSVEDTIVNPMIDELKQIVRTAFPDRAASECLLALEYPKSGSDTLALAKFFDSPRCLAFCRKAFKGYFIVSVVDHFAHEQLIDFINNNASPEFCFIILVNSGFNMKGLHRDIIVKNITLEIDKKSLSKQERTFYNKVKKEKIFTLLEFKRACDTMLAGGNKTEITKCFNDHVENERRIGF